MTDRKLELSSKCLVALVRFLCAAPVLGLAALWLAYVWQFGLPFGIVLFGGLVAAPIYFLGFFAYFVAYPTLRNSSGPSRRLRRFAGYTLSGLVGVGGVTVVLFGVWVLFIG
jgi:hypothetical protein